MITIYSATACPFAQRTRALLNRMNEPLDLREVDLDARDPELLEMSPTGKVPFLVDGDVRLFESAVINDYLAEKLGFDQAYSADVALRAEQRLLMRRWDDVVAPAFYRSMRAGGQIEEGAKANLRKELAFIARIVEHLDHDVHNLAGLHVATHWARMAWVPDLTELPALIEELPALRAWLDKAVALPEIQQTLPEPDAVRDRYRSRYAAASN